MKNIVVLMGGKSREKEISLASGENVSLALERLGYAVTRIDPEFDSIPNDTDFVYIALHGNGGEDGDIQAKLDLLNIPYTGSGALSSFVCFNKIITKKILNLYNFPTPKFFILEKQEDLENITQYPVVLKPALEGSSIGVVIVDDKNQILETYKNLSKEFDHLFAEEYIKGKEITVSILGDIVFPILELKPKNRFYDFQAKYSKGMTDFVLPANIEDDLAQKIRTLAKQVYHVLHCRGAVRVDLIIDEYNNPFILEVNTSPGMTNTSDLPAQAKAMDINFDELITLIVNS
jgi:D-alanine-D-alanine ligase